LRRGFTLWPFALCLCVCVCVPLASARAQYTHRFPDVKPAWDRLVSEGFVQNSQCAIKRLQPPTGWRGFCVGQRTHKPLREHGLPKPVDCSIRRPLESQAVFEARRPSGDRDHETSE
jgi:hypothetical protein